MSKPFALKERIPFKRVVFGNIRFVLICFGFIISLCIGSFAVSICDDGAYFGLSEYFENYLRFSVESSFADIFLYSSLSFLLLILINCILGLCVIGSFVNSLFIFVFGFGIGAVSSYIYCVYSLKGICYFILVLLPGIFLISLNYILSFKYSFDFSVKLLKSVGKNISVSFDLKLYFIRYIYFFVLTFAIGLINSFFIKTFTPIFDL